MLKRPKGQKAQNFNILLRVIVHYAEIKFGVENSSYHLRLNGILLVRTKEIDITIFNSNKDQMLATTQIRNKITIIFITWK